MLPLEWVVPIILGCALLSEYVWMMVDEVIRKAPLGIVWGGFAVLGLGCLLALLGKLVSLD